MPSSVDPGGRTKWKGQNRGIRFETVQSPPKMAPGLEQCPRPAVTDEILELGPSIDGPVMRGQRGLTSVGAAGARKPPRTTNPFACQSHDCESGTQQKRSPAGR